jgi:hypothetical protein
MRRIIPVFIVLSIFLLAPFLLAADSLPKTIGPLTLERVQSGEEARTYINRLHGKAITFKEGYIGLYNGRKETGKLWVSVYGNLEEAARGVERMAKGVKMSDGRGPFWHFQEKEIERMPVYFAVGLGQTHYFFRKGVMVVWLAVDTSAAEEAIRDLVKKIR